MRIMLVGGGSGGPVVPLLAVYKKIREEHPQAKFLLIGTNHGPERRLAEDNNINFVAVPAGKWRRYFSWRNGLAPFLVLGGFLKALSIISKFKPDVVFGAGGYSCVPVMFAAYIMRKKIVIHQQDILPTLTNKILAPIASRITVSFERSLKDFPSGSGLFSFKSSGKIVWTGNPFREELLERHSRAEIVKFRKKFGIVEELPVILVLGGATGALGLNQILRDALPELTNFAYVIHQSGVGKQISFRHPRYFQMAFISNIIEALTIADYVVSRAGLSTITELSILQKIALIIPMPNSHQLDNAMFLKDNNAAIVLNQLELNGQQLAAIIRKLMFDGEIQAILRENIGKLMPHDATRKLAKILVDICQKK